jgi:hypothetical protein
MALMPGIRNFAQGVHDIGDAFRAPGREAAARRAREEAATIQAQRQREAEDQARTQQQQSRQTLADRQAAIPVTTDEGMANQRVVDVGKDAEHGRATDMVGVQGNQVRQTIDTAVDGRVRMKGAEADANVATFQGWDSTIGARQDKIITGAQGHELALTDRFVGATPLSERLSGERQADRDTAMEMQRMQMNDPMRWVNAANQTAAVLGTLFL